MKQDKKNLFFPLTIEEVEEMDRLDQDSQEYLLVDEEYDGYGLFSSDWYDTIGGQNFLFFPKKSLYADETY
jgi:hypothetical protein